MNGQWNADLVEKLVQHIELVYFGQRDQWSSSCNVRDTKIPFAVTFRVPLLLIRRTSQASNL